VRIRWPEGTVFTQVVVNVEQDSCERCGSSLHVCDHRIRRVYTLEGPVRLCCRRRHCADPAGPLRSRTLSPRAELSVALPGWLVAWDVFCFIGHRRFARHWSVPQIRAELRDRYDIALTVAAVCKYLRRYQAMVAARQQDRQQLSAAYRNIDALVLTIDGLQPEKGHETLDTVREVNAQRVWFAESWLSSSTGEGCRLLGRARAIADSLGKPVRMWMSDKQDAFVKGVAQVFPDAPHRYCDKHFLRELAKPMRNADSHAKVQMRKQVRGLRAIERQALAQRPQAVAQPPSRKEVTAGKAGASAVPAAAKPGAARPRSSRAAGGAGKRSEPRGAPGQASRPTAKDSVAQVVLDYCAVVRGILNDDQGGPLQPTGLRMAEALREVRASLQRNLDLNKPGPGHGHLARLAGCIDRGLEAVQGQQQAIQKQVEQIRAVAETLKEDNGPRWQRKAKYEKFQREYAKQGGGFLAHLAKVMRSWAGGLFVRVKVKRGEERPPDNDELERWFRRPKSHARRIHGRQHAGMRIVQEGPTLLPTLNGHEAHPQPFTAAELLPYWQALEPDGQREALHRRKIMRKARSQKSGQHRCLS
jgi:prefoldin subunit 5